MIQAGLLVLVIESVLARWQLFDWIAILFSAKIIFLTNSRKFFPPKVFCYMVDPIRRSVTYLEHSNVSSKHKSNGITAFNHSGMNFNIEVLRFFVTEETTNCVTVFSITVTSCYAACLGAQCIRTGRPKPHQQTTHHVHARHGVRTNYWVWSEKLNEPPHLFHDVD